MYSWFNSLCGFGSLMISGDVAFPFEPSLPAPVVLYGLGGAVCSQGGPVAGGG